MSCHDMIRELAAAAGRGEASRLGSEFARFIARIAPEESCGVILGVYLACAVLEDSHTCLVLDPDVLSTAAEAKGICLKDARAVIKDIREAGVVGRPGDLKPLILDGNRLYLHRYWRYEQRIAGRLLALAGIRSRPSDELAAVELVKQFFPRCPARPDWQKIAVFNALYRNLLVISGGPGTGKTRTITAVMAVLLAASEKKDLIIAMCAPTGKAAARLTESVAEAIPEFGLPAGIVERMPVKAHTIHRLLGAGLKPGVFRFNRETPLPHDVVIVDEVSMVDLPMMVHLLDALHEHAKLVLLGDRDQLASVEAGSVLRDICAGSGSFSYSHDFVERAGKIGEKIEPEISGSNSAEGRSTELRDCIIVLGHSYRFSEGTGIAELASAVNRGRFTEVSEILGNRRFPRVRFISAAKTDLPALLESEVSGFIRELPASESQQQALKKMGDFRILCGLKRGYTGVEYINRHIAAHFFQAMEGHGRGLYRGLPVIINRNDYMLGLYNGDTGIAWPDETGRLRIWFDAGENGLRCFSPARLPTFDPAWSITVHRSQGSEFSKVLFVLPSEKTAMPGRELLYTAITRARDEIIIWGTWRDLEACVVNRTRRNSGLGAILWESAG